MIVKISFKLSAMAAKRNFVFNEATLPLRSCYGKSSTTTLRTSKQAKKKTRMFIISLLVCLIALSAYLYWENTTIEVTFLEVVDSAIPVDFDGFTIAHISDLHNTEFGQQQERLLQKLVEAAPDLIAITGDLLDSITRILR